MSMLLAPLNTATPEKAPRVRRSAAATNGRCGKDTDFIFSSN
jgi:hypothetical protein